jgi:putative spermidine/putrescine transport system substrate-binding protein
MKSLRALVAVTTLAALVAACSGGGATQAPTAAAPSAAAPSAAAPSAAAPSAAAVDWKTATSAGEGGVDAVCEAAKAEGELNVIALPPNWANYGQIIDDFAAKYGIKVNSAMPEANSQQEIDQAKALAGTGRQPDVFDLGLVVRDANLDMFAPYQTVNWAEIPDVNKAADGAWINNYAGYMSIGYDANKVGPIATVADLADPKYKGKVALNGDPLAASAGLNGILLAALANGGSADDIGPGVDFMKKLVDMGNLLPVNPTEATVASGQTPIQLDWVYNQLAYVNSLKPKGINWTIAIPTDAAPVAAFYNAAINKDAAHPAAARCWTEYLFSDAGQNAWLKGGAIPVRIAAMQTAGTADAEALAAINPPTTAPVIMTPDQNTKAKDYLTENWKITWGS